MEEYQQQQQQEAGIVECSKSQPLVGAHQEGAKKGQKKESSGRQLEKADKERLNKVRTSFYGLNKRFESVLQFKPIRQLSLH